ncbi:MAG: glycerate kinase [Deltaproteobacteria bacterium]|jgi:glycerate kinase|nr:glycerate kinase [Deltaproteobacteria bacterium]
MLIVIAPDSYKGSLSALAVAKAMRTGAARVFPEARFDLVPIADGGEGTVDALIEATKGTLKTTEVRGPLGAPVAARWGMLGNGETAIIEMASASGLPLLAHEARDAMNACTFGTGELVKTALDAGAKTIILGIGGSATNDGGSGFARALGAKFLDAAGKELRPGGAALAKLASIDVSGLDPRLATTPFRVACDVDNPLCGPRGASAVFGPQKGASPEQVKALDAALAVFAEKAEKATGRKGIAEISGAGAAGGLGAGLLFFANASLMPGVSLVLEATAFDARVKNASLVLTGEGRTDFQTAYGKAPVGVALAAKKYGHPVICISGGLGQGAQDVYAHGVDALSSITPGPLSLEACMADGGGLLEDAAERACRLLAVGMGLRG